MELLSFSTVFAEGKIYTVDTQDTLLCQAYYNPSIYDTVEQMAGTTALRQIEVPKDLIGKTFEDAFRRFSKSGEHIVVGLYTVEGRFEDLDGDGIEDLPPPKGCKKNFTGTWEFPMMMIWLWQDVLRFPCSVIEFYHVYVQTLQPQQY